MREKILHDRYKIQRQLRKYAGRQTLLSLDLPTQEQVIMALFKNGVFWVTNAGQIKPSFDFA